MDSTSPAYAGPDRRQRALAHMRPPAGQTLTAVGAMVLVSGLAVPLMLGHLLSADSADTAFVVVRVLAAMLVTLAGALSLIRWRMTGEATVAMYGSALILFGSVGVLPALLRVSMPGPAVPLVRAANGLIVLFVLLCALVAPTVTASVRPGRLIGLGAVTMLVLDALFYRDVNTGGRLTGDQLGTRLGVAMAGVWTLLAIGSFVRGRLQGQARWIWLGLAAIAVAFTEAARAASYDDPRHWLLASACLQLTAGMVWCFATGHELLAVLSDQGNSLISLSDRLSRVSERLDESRARDEERVHDARAALCAVQSAMATLTRYYERLEAESRSGLERAVDAELGRLRHLLDNVNAGDFVFFDLAAAIEPVVIAQRTHGAKIDLQVGSFCWARGRPADTATVVQTLLENARRYAPGSPITVRISRADGRVVLAVEDQGRGVPGHERQSIFTRGGRGYASRGVPGSGLGLFIAARLMHDQLGDIGVHDGATGGACFVLTFAQPDDIRGSLAPRSAVGHRDEPATLPSVASA
jgi:signal transduction histidine kinase